MMNPSAVAVALKEFISELEDLDSTDLRTSHQWSEELLSFLDAREEATDAEAA